jgi:hypothetical protein
VWGKELFFDSTKVGANASTHSRRSRSLVEDRLEEHLAGAFREDTPFAQEVDLPGAVIAGFVGPEADERRELARTNAPRHRWIENNGRQEREAVRWGYRKMADLRVSTTDPERLPHAPEEGLEQTRLPDPLPRRRG